MIMQLDEKCNLDVIILLQSFQSLCLFITVSIGMFE